MKRKLTPKPEPTETVAPEILESAKRYVAIDAPKVLLKCSVCKGDAAVMGEEQLCWICRRLKISAWRDVESQIPMQE